MECNHKGSIGPLYSTGLLLGYHTETTSMVDISSTTLFPKATPAHLSEGQETPPERVNNCNGINLPDWVPIEPISSPKKEWRSEASYQSKGLELSHSTGGSWCNLHHYDMTHSYVNILMSYYDDIS